MKKPPINPLIHFLLSGAAQGRNPHPEFDLRYYLENNPDVAEAGGNPLAHFLQYGLPEGRAPHDPDKGGGGRSHSLSGARAPWWQNGSFFPGGKKDELD